MKLIIKILLIIDILIIINCKDEPDLSIDKMNYNLDRINCFNYLLGYRAGCEASFTKIDINILKIQYLNHFCKDYTLVQNRSVITNSLIEFLSNSPKLIFKK